MSWKLSRTVLRGGTNGNIGPLLGQKNGKIRQPHCFEVDGGRLFAFAGLWDRWKDVEGKIVETCSILTTAANAVTSAVHDRMPVILDQDTFDVWLDPGMNDAATTSDLLKPYEAHRMRSYPVSTRLNQVQNDDAECAAPCAVEAAPQGSLFL